MKIKLIKTYRGKINEVINVSNSIGRRLIEEGIAKRAEIKDFITQSAFYNKIVKK